jgi:SAM-dependent methyltransferase
MSKDRDRWNERYAAGYGASQPNPRLAKYLHLLQPGLALDLASGNGKNAELLAGCKTVLADISDRALEQTRGMRVLVEAPALPFPAGVFDTILCTYFFEPRVDFALLLKAGGTLFFETYTSADAKYRPDFPASYRLNASELARIFPGLGQLAWEERDDGSRVMGTFVGYKV